MKSILFCLLICFHLSLFADLKFDALDIKKSVSEQSVEAVEFEFRFANEGTKNVSIKNIKTSCGCVFAKSDKQIYAAGETGVLTAKFEVGDRIGTQLKQIVISTDDEKQKNIVLGISLNIEKLCDIFPQVLLWSKSETSVAKKSTFKFHAKNFQKIESLDCSSEAFEVSIESSNNTSLILEIKPKATEKALTSTNAKISATLLFQNGIKKEYFIHALIR